MRWVLRRCCRLLLQDFLLFLFPLRFCLCLLLRCLLLFLLLCLRVSRCSLLLPLLSCLRLLLRCLSCPLDLWAPLRRFRRFRGCLRVLLLPFCTLFRSLTLLCCTLCQRSLSSALLRCGSLWVCLRFLWLRIWPCWLHSSAWSFFSLPSVV